MNIDVASRIMLACFVGSFIFTVACDDAPKTAEGKPDPDWGTDIAKNWAKGMKTDLRGVHCAYHASYAICDIAYPNDSLDQLKCYHGKDDETPRGCHRIGLMKVDE